MNAIGGHAGRSHVSASKHAVWGMTKTLAKEFGPKGVTCNVISPGTIQGEVADARLIEANAKLKYFPPLIEMMGLPVLSPKNVVPEYSPFTAKVGSQ